MQRRTLLSAVVVPIGAAGGLYFLSKQPPKMANTPGEFEVTKTDAEWRKLLTPEQFNVLRHRTGWN
jgi:peptide-methionine (R)-S-oxide reductase